MLNIMRARARARVPVLIRGLRILNLFCILCLRSRFAKSFQSCVGLTYSRESTRAVRNKLLKFLSKLSVITMQPKTRLI